MWLSPITSLTSLGARAAFYYYPYFALKACCQSSFRYNDLFADEAWFEATLATRSRVLPENTLQGRDLDQVLIQTLHSPQLRDAVGLWVFELSLAHWDLSDTWCSTHGVSGRLMEAFFRVTNDQNAHQMSSRSQGVRSWESQVSKLKELYIYTQISEPVICIQWIWPREAQELIPQTHFLT